jgi:hypothetical protein
MDIENRIAAVLVLILPVHCKVSHQEDFWFIVAVRSEDEVEIRAGQLAEPTLGSSPEWLDSRE